MEKITFAIPKGRNLKPSIELFKSVGFDFTRALSDSRQLVFKTDDGSASALVVRDADIPTYVEHGAADIGVSGSDVLMEQGKTLYEPLDLMFGACRMVVAEPAEMAPDDSPKEWTHVRIATKFPNITEAHFASRGIQIEIIKLYGSIELAPKAGLAERIVDLVSTGETMRQNGLVEVEKIMDVSARLVVNRASFKIKHEPIKTIVDDIREFLRR